MDRLEFRDLARKVDKNSDHSNQQDLAIMGLSKDLEGFRREEKLREEAQVERDRLQTLALKTLSEKQEKNRDAIDKAFEEARDDREANLRAINDIGATLRDLKEGLENIDKRTTPPERPSVSSIVAVAAPPAATIPPPALHPVASPLSSAVAQMSSTQKGVYGGVAAGSVSGIGILIYQIIQMVIAGL